MAKTWKDQSKRRNPVTYDMIQSKRNARHNDKRKTALAREIERELKDDVTVNKEDKE
jgi:hypothetical protein